MVARVSPTAIAAAALLLGAALCGSLRAQVPGPAAGERQPFQAALLVPPNDKDYVVAKIPAGATAVVTDVIAYNAADGKGHRVGPNTESYLWLGGYADGKAAGLINRLRILGTETQQWRLQTGLELRGALELVVSSEKGAAGETAALVHVSGYIRR